MVKKALKGATPPFLIKTARKMVSLAPNALFDGGHALFKANVADAKLYGEYGCGASTRWVLEHTDARVRSVDASAAWVSRVTSRLGPEARARLEIEQVELGELGEWGRPVAYTHRQNFQAYTDFLWAGDKRPDVVLIDGRFRVCAFLTCLLHAEPGTRLIFDDYTNRPHYHSVEHFVTPRETYRRQCLFVAPGVEQLDRELLLKEIEAFRLVME